MTAARERMLARIRARQGKPPHAGEDERVRVQSHIAAHPRSPAPRLETPPLERFRERALSLASTVELVHDLAEVPARCAFYLRERGLPLRAVCWSELAALDWAGSGLEVEARGARADDLVGITGAFCAIAETGTLMTVSGAHTPPTVSLLPETHIAVVPTDRVIPSMEDAWQRLRSTMPALPRAVNFISGPSRTADIEQTVTLGAHGPYRVHIILVEG